MDRSSSSDVQMMVMVREMGMRFYNPETMEAIDAMLQSSNPSMNRHGMARASRPMQKHENHMDVNPNSIRTGGRHGCEDTVLPHTLSSGDFFS